MERATWTNSCFIPYLIRTHFPRSMSINSTFLTFCLIASSMSEEKNMIDLWKL